MSNKFVALLAFVIIVVGGYTVATIYSKLSGRPVVRFFHCENTAQWGRKCRIQRDVNDLLKVILPDKSPKLIEKFSPTPPSEL